MTRDKLSKMFMTCLTLGSLCFGVVSAETIPSPIVEVPNAVEKPEYDTSVRCTSCEKLEYQGIEPRDAFFNQDRRPAILEGGVKYQEEEEMHVGGKSSFTPTTEEIVEDEVIPESKP